MEAAAQIIFHSIICSAVVITDMEKILAIRTKKAYECLADPGFLTPVLQSVTDLKPTYFQQADFPDNMKNVLKDQIIVTAPLLEGEHAIGGLTIVLKSAGMLYRWT